MRSRALSYRETIEECLVGRPSQEQASSLLEVNLDKTGIQQIILRRDYPDQYSNNILAVLKDRSMIEQQAGAFWQLFWAGILTEMYNCLAILLRIWPKSKWL